MSNIENIIEQIIETPAIEIKKTRTCYLCLVTYDLENFCKSNKSKRCGKCLYQKKKAYMQQYYKDHRQEIIDHEMEKYNAINANKEKKKVGRKKHPIIINSEI